MCRFVGKFVKKSDRVLLNPNAKYTNLYMKNLDPEITEDYLNEKFSEFGKIVSLVISKSENGASKGFGFVNFESPHDARRAMEAMNGSQLGRLCFVGNCISEQIIVAHDLIFEHVGYIV